jgi:hypothetical protein
LSNKLDHKPEIKRAAIEALQAFRAKAQRWEALPEEEGMDLVKKCDVFQQEAFDDLCYLISRGANPFIVMDVIFTDMWVGTLYEDYEEMRRLTSKGFWGKQKRNRGQNRLGRVCRKMQRADEALRDAIRLISDLNLDDGSWVIEYRVGGPNLKKTSKKGREKSGPTPRSDWAVCGAELVVYLTMRAGSPHHRQVCRILRSAGSLDFVDGRPDDIDRLRMRVKRLNKDEVATYGIKARLTDYEGTYETRPPVHYDDIGTLLGRFEVGGGGDK